jgi:hypothetical protein
VHEVVRPMLHRNKLRTRAVDWYFNILAHNKFELKYASQLQDDEHHTMDLALPAYTDDLYIELLMCPKTNFQITYLHMKIDRNTGRQPLVKYFFYPFIERGVREKRPDRDHPYYDANHAIDYHKCYHIMDVKDRRKGDIYPYGFMIETRAPGIYPLVIGITADGQPFSARLTLYVEERPHTRYRCFKHDECFVVPKARSAEALQAPEPSDTPAGK